jgi:hypothetical protein
MPISKEENQNSAQILLKSWGFHNSLPRNVVIFLKISKNSLDHVARWDFFFNTKTVKFCHRKNHCFSAVFFFSQNGQKATLFSEMGVFCEKFL